MLSVPFQQLREAAINEVVELEASAVFPARLRTSSATTAKAFSGLSGTGGLYSCIQGQYIGLKCDILNGFDNMADFVGALP